jgi:hypothetical protein
MNDNSMAVAGDTSRAPGSRVPLYVGLGAAVIAIVLSVFGMVRNTGLAALTPVSLLLVILIAGGSWGVVAWAITTAVYDVESDIAEDEGETLPNP